jgi:hypothetical protein
MRIDQRNAGAAVTANGAYPVDRFIANNSNDGAYSAQRDTVAPTGFINSLKWTTTTADGSLSASQYAGIGQLIEGFNTADLAWGSANAKTVTFSFWVRSSLTGTFGGALRNSAANRSYPFTYSISVADTWEYKTVTVAGDTSGTWVTDNGVGIRVFFGLGAGTDWSGTAGAWNSNNNLTATGAVSVIGTLNATFYVTGVQLEVGSVATPFERRPYGMELALCQRYYELYDGGILFLTKLRESDRNRYGNFFLKVTKRASATITLITSSTDGGGAINATGGIDGGVFSSLSTADNQAPNVTKFSASAEL